MRRPSPRKSSWLLAAVVAAASAAISAPQATGATALPQTEAAQEEFRFVDLDGEPLRLTDEEIIDVLANGRILEQTRVSEGINGIDRLLLEKDGIRLHGGFREVDMRQRNARVGGETYMLFRDSFRFEPAAYRLAQALGIDNLPPAVMRRVRAVDGSVQFWVEDTYESIEDAPDPPSALAFAQQGWTVKFFDALIYNVDRNPGNLLIDRRHNLWMIDHTRAFQMRDTLFEIDEVGRAPARAYRRLKEMERADFERIFSGALEAPQIGFFMQRRDLMIEHIDQLIRDRGHELAVLY